MKHKHEKEQAGTSVVALDLSIATLSTCMHFILNECHSVQHREGETGGIEVQTCF